jgi:transcriptional regulator with XRE-family HTH domain
VTRLQRIGIKIRRARVEKNLKQEDIGKFLGKSKSTISCYENGKKRISVENLQKLCNLLEINITSL